MIRIEITIGLLATVLTVLLILVYGANEEDRMVRRTRAYDVRAVERGAAAFDQYCADCHGPNAAGGMCPPLDAQSGLQGGEIGPEIAWRLEDLGVDRSGGYAYVYSAIDAGRNVSTRPWKWVGSRTGDDPTMAMPAWGEAHNGPLRRDQMADLAAYIMAFGDEIPDDYDEAQAFVAGVDKNLLSDEPVSNPKPDGSDPVALGAWIFEDRACVTCHAYEGISSAEVGPDLNDILATATERIAADDYSGSANTAIAYIEESILDPAAYTVDGYAEGLMPSTYSDLSDADLAALIAFLTGLDSDASSADDDADEEDASEEEDAEGDEAASEDEEEAEDEEAEGDTTSEEAIEATPTP